MDRLLGLHDVLAQCLALYKLDTAAYTSTSEVGWRIGSYSHPRLCSEFEANVGNVTP